jgi:hypothetical protein
MIFQIMAHPSATALASLWQLSSKFLPWPPFESGQN